MSVWPSLTDSHATLAGTEGTLVSICVPVPPRYLEALLEALAQLDFPINPQIYHDASVEYCYADGRIETEPATLVEFPAYQGRLEQVRGALKTYGFAEDSVHVAEQWSDILADELVEPTPSGGPYASRVYRKHVAVNTH